MEDYAGNEVAALRIKRKISSTERFGMEERLNKNENWNGL